jgi:thiamine-monophosphate kinase
VSSEFELIERIKGRLAGRAERVLIGPGDDAAVVQAGGVIVTSVDAFVDGVHFRTSTSCFSDIGHKCVAGTLSDIAAMGARAGELYLVIGLSEQIGEQEALALVDGAEALAAQLGASICGGDIVRSAQLFVAVTAVGHAESRQTLVTRSRAKSGDLVGVTGELGGAAAGLALLDREIEGTQDRIAEALRERYLRPLPQLAAGRALAEAGVGAMIDLSDGVASDALRLAEASGVEIEVELERLPIQAGVEEVATMIEREAIELAATGGEDYELLFTCPEQVRERVELAMNSTRTRLTWIGTVGDGTGVRLLDADGGVRDLRGWDHLQ